MLNSAAKASKGKSMTQVKRHSIFMVMARFPYSHKDKSDATNPTQNNALLSKDLSEGALAERARMRHTPNRFTHSMSAKKILKSSAPASLAPGRKWAFRLGLALLVPLFVL